MPGLPERERQPLKASSFLVECQQCRQSFVVEVPVGFYVPSCCASCRKGPDLVPIKSKPDPDEAHRRRFRFRE